MWLRFVAKKDRAQSGSKRGRKAYHAILTMHNPKLDRRNASFVQIKSEWNVFFPRRKEISDGVWRIDYDERGNFGYVIPEKINE